MKSALLPLLFFISVFVFGQDNVEKKAIELTLNNYIDGFYQGDSLKLKEALKPRLYKFGYWKNKDSGEYEYSNQMTYQGAMDFAKGVVENNRQKGEDVKRNVEVLDIGNHIAAAKVTAWWGIDYMLLSKENGKWMIEQVIWEGPLEKSHLN